MPTAVALPDIPALCDLLASHRYRIQDEASLQSGIEQVLRAAHHSFIRESVLDPANRPDFQLEGLAVEIKIKGSFAAFMRQARRYLEKPEIEALLVVGTPRWVPQVPAQFLGKPIYSVRLTGSLL